MAAGQKVAYKRVSTADQTTARQLEGQGEFDEVFEDKASGKNLERPAFEAMLKHVRKGDTVFVHSMDRLARNLRDLDETIEKLNAKGVSVRFVKEGLVFEAGQNANPFATLMMQMLGSFAQFERTLILERQREGIAIAKKDKDKYKGGVAKFDKAKLAEEARRRIAGGETVVDIAKSLGCTRQTLYNAMKADSAKEA